MSAPVARFDVWGHESPFAEAEDSFEDSRTEYEDVGEDEDVGEYEQLDEYEEFDPEYEAGEFDPEYEEFADLDVDYQTAPSSVSEVRFPSGTSLRVVAGRTGKGEEHWDPKGPGLPLLDTGLAVRGLKLSDHFTVGELTTSGGRAADVARISPALVVALEAIRNRAGRAVKIRSGYRSWFRNKEVYKRRGDDTPTLSRHCSGQAADIAIPGLDGTAIAKLAIDALGTGIGIGVGSNFAHIDVRGTWTLWNYGGVTNWPAVKRSIEAHRDQRGKARPPVPPSPSHFSPSPPPPPPPAATGFPGWRQHAPMAGRSQRPFSAGTAWTGRPPSTSSCTFTDTSGRQDGCGSPTGWRASAASTFSDPSGATSGVGRTRPTLLILPRGKSEPTAKRADRFTFPALLTPGAIASLVRESLHVFRERTGVSAPRGRLILTAHSGGGAPLNHIVRDADPDEVFVYDGLYGSGANIAEWAAQRIRKFAAAPASEPPALRVLFGAGTARSSRALASSVCTALRDAGMERLAPRFRVEQTGVPHGDIPKKFGWRLLADAGADVAARRVECSAPRQREDESTEADRWEAAYALLATPTEQFTAWDAGQPESIEAVSESEWEQERGVEQSFADEWEDAREAETPAGGPPSAQLGTLVVRKRGRTFTYRFTPTDLLWTAKLLVHETGGRDDSDSAAVLCAMLNRYGLFAHTRFATFSGFVRAYSTTLQPVLLSWRAAQRSLNKPGFRKTGGYYTKNPAIPRGQLQKHIDIQNAPWSSVKPEARSLALRALTGRLVNPGIGLASEFASTRVYYRQSHGGQEPTDAQWRQYTIGLATRKKWRWVGDVPQLNQRKNAFFLDVRAQALPPDAVRVLPPAAPAGEIDAELEAFDEDGAAESWETAGFTPEDSEGAPELDSWSEAAFLAEPEGPSDFEDEWEEPGEWSGEDESDTEDEWEELGE